MKSYAIIDRIEGNYAVCEVELVNIEESRALSPFDKETEMIDVPIRAIKFLVGEVSEQNVLVVEFYESEVVWIYYRDEEEELRRKDLLKKFIK